jgi:hypothetical protein
MFVMAFIVILATASTIVELTFCPACKINYYISYKIHSLKKKKKKKILSHSYRSLYAWAPQKSSANFLLKSAHAACLDGIIIFVGLYNQCLIIIARLSLESIIQTAHCTRSHPT